MGSVVWAMVLDMEDVAREIYICICPSIYTTVYIALACKRGNVRR